MRGIPCPRPTLWPAGYLTTFGRAILEAVPPPAPAGEAAGGVTGPPVYRVRGGLRELAAAGMDAGDRAGSAGAWHRLE